MLDLQNGSNMDIRYDYEKCIGLKVKPRKGDGLLFYSMFTNHTIDPVSTLLSSDSFTIAFFVQVGKQLLFAY